MRRSFALSFLLQCSFASAADIASLFVDRAAIERVYYNHRLGQKPPFEQVLPPATLEKLVGLDLRKEAALLQVYGVEVTAAMLDTEVRRIEATTRAPDVLAEIKAALGNDASRFARAFARPILVETLLRQRFDNDDALHALLRRQVERKRGELLAAKKIGSSYDELLALLKRDHAVAVTETTWQLGAPPADNRVPAAEENEIKRRFGPNAQVVSPPRAAVQEPQSYFGDLPGDLQKVLRAQLRGSGDVSAVIETPTGFLLYVTKQKTDAALRVAALSLRKRDYEQWLAERTDSPAQRR